LSWQPLIAAAAKRVGILVAWIRAVMRAESGGRTALDGRPITSTAGAMGLMQVMPETYRAMQQRLGLDADPYDPRDNIFAGAAYLRDMYDRFGYAALFAAYNAGPAASQAYLDGPTSLPNET
jgi:soluble lytic murein transglycosylase-like protein